jgi:hypothetical protein
MKYFTAEWWLHEVEDMEAPRQAYWRYIDTIRPFLTPALKSLLDDVSLHDAKLRSLSIDTANKKMTMVLDGYVDPWSPDGNRPRRFTLVYNGLQSFQVKHTASKALFNTDLGYHETERLEGGLFEHRILFSSETELVIQYSDLQMEFVDLQEPVT